MGTNSGAKLWPTTTSSGYWEWTCVGSTVGAGSANVGVLWTNLDGTVVKSNAMKAVCAGGHTLTQRHLIRQHMLLAISLS